MSTKSLELLIKVKYQNALCMLATPHQFFLIFFHDNCICQINYTVTNLLNVSLKCWQQNVWHNMVLLIDYIPLVLL